MLQSQCLRSASATTPKSFYYIYRIASMRTFHNILRLFCLGMGITYSPSINKMKKTVKIKKATFVEYVTFLAKAGVSKEEMLEAAKSTDAILERIKGFRHRFISLQENKTWVEIVFWENKELAESGLKLFLADPKSKDFLDKIQEDSIKIEYSEIL